MQILIDTRGAAYCVYDEVIDLSCLGPLTITRASQLEPDAMGCWHADLSLLAPGTLLGPYRRRSDALAAEREWLERHWLTGDGSKQTRAGHRVRRDSPFA